MFCFNTYRNVKPNRKSKRENFKRIWRIIEFELLENKINKINKIKIEKIREIIKKGLEELEIKTINKIKEQEEIETKLRIPMKEELEGFEIKRLEIETDIRMEILKQTE